jgi:phage gpG-like protein
MARRPLARDIRQSINGLRINQNITTAMLPHLTFSPSLGITARRIDALGMDIRSYREPLKRSIQQVISPSIGRNFATGGRPAWEPLSPDTLEIQQRISGIGQHAILVKTGHLQAVAQQLSIWTITRDSAIIQGDSFVSRVPYAGVQQAGYEGRPSQSGRASTKSLKQIVGEARAAARARGGQKSKDAPSIPARPFVMLQAEDLPKIDEVFMRWMGERIDAKWPR